EFTPGRREAFVGTAVYGAGNHCCRKLARFHASSSLDRRRNLHADFEIESIRAHLAMVSEDSADGRYALLGKCRHQLADGRSEHLHHLAARNDEGNDGGRLGFGLNDLWRRNHDLSPVMYIELGYRLISCDRAGRSSLPCRPPCRLRASQLASLHREASCAWSSAFHCRQSRSVSRRGCPVSGPVNAFAPHARYG